MRSLILVSTVFLTIQLVAQNNILEGYINEGLESNLVIKQNQMALESAEQALKIAKGMFLPVISTQSRYSLAHGGRTIDFPIGDLLNPVYSTLNDMLVSQGGTAQFPFVENEQINFLRQQEYEAKISVTQPIFYPSIAINKKIEQQKLYMTQTEMESYKRELTFQIKEAYYNYMKALQYNELIKKTKDVVNENHRVSQKLTENDMITLDAVLRTKSEISKIELYETEALKNTEMAKSYFNFLLNRDMDGEIIIEMQEEVFVSPELDSLTSNAVKNRQELRMLDYQINIMSYATELATANMLPNLFLAVDYGIQGEEFNAINESDFVMGSLVLKWNLFEGNANRNKQKQTIINKMQVEYYKEEMENKIKLEVKRDIYEVNQQIKNLQLAETRSNEADEVYRIIEKRYRVGESPLIELLDARNNMTEANAQMILTTYDYLVSIARLEKSSNTSLAL